MGKENIWRWAEKLTRKKNYIARKKKKKNKNQNAAREEKSRPIQCERTAKKLSRKI